ncbi:MAG: GGDEF domain-containing protein [Marinobacterium sp.]
MNTGIASRLVNLLWLCIGASMLLLFALGEASWDTFEELFWFTMTLSVMLLYARGLARSPMLLWAWGLFFLGQGLDILDDHLSNRELPLLQLDTSLKSLGFILLCFGFLELLKKYQANIQALKQEVLTRSNLQRQLEYDALHDELTRLGNRRACFGRMESLVCHCSRLYYFDLDRFKLANDTLGHREGDRVLVSFAQALGARFGADNCFRLGGDEFVAFADDERDVEALRQHLNAAIASDIVTVSIGFTETRAGLDADALLHLADEAMYLDKGGRCQRRRDPAC